MDDTKDQMHIFDLVLGLDTAHVLSMPFLLSSTCPDSLIPLGAHYTSYQDMQGFHPRSLGIIVLLEKYNFLSVKLLFYGIFHRDN